MSELPGPADLPELLERAIGFLRTGQFARGALSWLTYQHHRDDVDGEDGEDEGEITRAMQRADYARAADVIEYSVLPRVRARAANNAGG